MNSLRGKVIAVTGAASGIGKATAQVLCARGASLALCDIQGENLERVAKSLTENLSPKQRVSYQPLDVTQTKHINEWIWNIKEDFGQLDGAANIAGVVRRSPFGTLLQDTPDDDWEFTMRTNATGIFKCLRAQLNVISEGGSIVNISSIAGLDGAPGCGAYSPSKQAIVALTRAAARETAHRRIRVNAIAPGLVDTPLVLTDGFPLEEHEKQIPMKRIGHPVELAQMIAVLLSDESSYLTGQTVRVDGGLRV